MSEYYWSPSEECFFPSALYGTLTLNAPSDDDADTLVEIPNPDCKLPPDAIPVETATYKQALAAREQGKQVVAGDDGQPLIIDPPAETLEQLANRKRRELNAARDAAFAQGMEYNLNGETDVVQTRPEDQLNLIALSAKAQRMIAAGHPDATLTFRGAENVNREITATEMDALTMAALAHIEGIYQKSWQLKDALDTAEREEDREAIETLRW